MDNVFDVIVLGTGLSESIAAAALAKAGLKVAHVDPNAYYGADEATLTLDELVRWAETHSTHLPEDEPVRYRVDHLSPGGCPPHPKQYSLSLSPSVIPSIGPFISAVISSGVARYGSYKLLGPVAIYRDGKIQSVPQDKASIFQDRSVPLVEKRRLMRFLTFASGEFENSPELRGNGDTSFDRFLCDAFGLSKETCQAIAFSLAFCDFSGEPTSTALHRVRSCLRSVGRYGSSPFLVGYYGGAGEITQAFCRATAVNGGVYILGRKMSNLAVNGATTEARAPERFTVELDDIPDPLHSRCILSSMACVPRTLRSRAALVPLRSSSGLGSGSDAPGARSAHRRQVHAVARCITIVDGTVPAPRLSGADDDVPSTEGQSDSYLIVFPPGSLDGGSPTSSVTLLTAGAGTLSAPSDKSIVYLSMPLHERAGSEESSKDLLLPYLTRFLGLHPSCRSHFQVFYVQYVSPPPDPPSEGDVIPGLFAFSHLQPDVFQSVDQAARDAESAFWSALQAVDPQRAADRERGIWMNDPNDGTSEEDAD